MISRSQIARLPEQPGVYLYYNGQGDTLYVGKASVLRDRVRSYLGAHGISPRIDALLDEAQRLEVIVTDSVVEALALENNLIKQRAPKYNILLRDDKTYPYLQLTTGEDYPSRPRRQESRARRALLRWPVHAGIAGAADDVADAQAVRPALVQRGDHRRARPRPCLEFDIKRCVAPCVRELCSEADYRVAVQHTRMFLEGRNDELLITLRDRMTEAARSEHFEHAAQLRDAIRTIETLQARQQKMASPELGDRDAFGLKVGPAGAVVQVFQMRRGRVVERIELVTDAEPRGAARTAAPTWAGAEGRPADERRASRACRQD